MSQECLANSGYTLVKILNEERGKSPAVIVIVNYQAVTHVHRLRIQDQGPSNECSESSVPPTTPPSEQVGLNAVVQNALLALQSSLVLPDGWSDHSPKKFFCFVEYLMNLAAVQYHIG